MAVFQAAQALLRSLLEFCEPSSSFFIALLFHTDSSGRRNLNLKEQKMKLRPDHTIRNAYRQTVSLLNMDSSDGAPFSTELKQRIEFLERVFDL